MPRIELSHSRCTRPWSQYAYCREPSGMARADLLVADARRAQNILALSRWLECTRPREEVAGLPIPLCSWARLQQERRR